MSVPTAESTAWDTPAPAENKENAWGSKPAPSAVENKEAQGAWGNVITAETTPAAASEGAKSSLIPESGAKKSWASMFAKPKQAPIPAVPKPAAVPPPVPAELAAKEETSVPESKPAEPETEPEAPQQQPQASEQPAPAVSVDVAETPKTPAESTEATLAPSNVPLTEDNLEHLPDVSHPPATLTAASTVGSIDPRGVTPSAGQQPPIGRPPMGGYAASAYRATGTPARSASYQRRVLEQQEAVVMPGHNAVDRAAVQFGSMGLNGDAGLDVDDEREEPETRQAPQHSPPSQPRASLPPAARQDVPLTEALPTPRQAPGLPPVPQQQQPASPITSAPQGLPQEPIQPGQGYGQYSRFGQPEAAAPSQKSYDPFSNQTPTSAFDHYSSQSQPSAQQQHGFGGFSSGPSDYSQYYTADQRNAYQNYYGGSYGQQTSQTQQDAGATQQRATSGFGSGPSDTAFSTSQAPQQVGKIISLESNEATRRHMISRYVSTPHRGAPSVAGGLQRQPSNPKHAPWVAENADPINVKQYIYPNISNQSKQTPSRYGEAPGSGQNTPAPVAATQHQPAGQSQQMHQPQHTNQYGYPYGHPYYHSPYQAAYQNQFGYSQLGGYGSPYGKQQGGMYGPSGYGMNPPSSFDHASSPAASAGGFNQASSIQSRDSGLSGGLGDYGRSSAQPSNLGSSGFGGMSEPFGRAQSGFQGQSQGYGQQQSAQQSAPSDDLKPFSESKTGGPSPALGQPGRPGSATNSVGGQTSSGLPPPQSHQQGFGGYPGFQNSQSQYGGLGGLGGHQGQQGHQQGGYGGYSGFGNTYGNNYGARGWGNNYGGH